MFNLQAELAFQFKNHSSRFSWCFHECSALCSDFRGNHWKLNGLQCHTKTSRYEVGINREPKSMFYLLLNETFVYDVPALLTSLDLWSTYRRQKSQLLLIYFFTSSEFPSTIFLWTWLWQISCFLRLSPRSTS